MKPLTLLLLFGLFFGLNVQAQKPFRFKLIAFFEDISDFSIHTDTLYFGCDSLGGEGYQEGLDILDTQDINQPNNWLISDTIIEKQLNLKYKANTKQNIKAFNFNNRVTWKTTFNATLFAIKFDSTEMVYKDQSRYLRNAGINCNGCSISSWHKDYEVFIVNWEDNNTGYFYSDSIEILETNYTMNIFCRINDSLLSGLDEKNIQLNLLSENPVNEYLQMQLNNNLTGQLILTDVAGSTIANWVIQQNYKQPIQLDFRTIKSGLYYLTFIPDHVEYQKSVLKILKK